MPSSLPRTTTSSSGQGVTGPSAGVRIADWEFLQAEQICVEYLERVAAAGEAFVATLRSVHGYAIIDQEWGIADQTQQRADETALVIARIRSVIATLSGKARQFVERVDEVDHFMFGEDG